MTAQPSPQAALRILHLIDCVRSLCPRDLPQPCHLNQLEYCLLKQFYDPEENQGSDDGSPPPSPASDFLTHLCQCLDYLIMESNRARQPEAAHALLTAREKVQKLLKSPAH